VKLWPDQLDRLEVQAERARLAGQARTSTDPSTLAALVAMAKDGLAYKRRLNLIGVWQQDTLNAFESMPSATVERD
jgi:hypothetical protein